MLKTELSDGNRELTLLLIMGLEKANRDELREQITTRRNLQFRFNRVFIRIIFSNIEE